MSVRILLFAGALGTGCFTSAGAALAQTCAAPNTIQPDVGSIIAFDTCQGDSTLLLACGMFPLAGPATVFDLHLPYPAGLLSIESLDNNFRPQGFLLDAECSGEAPCSAVIEAGIDDTIDLSTLDSGHYFLVVSTSTNTFGTPCGVASVRLTITPEQQASMLEGVFRSGIAPHW